MNVLDFTAFMRVHERRIECISLINELVDCAVAQDTDKLEEKKKEIKDKIDSLEVDTATLIAASMLKPFYSNGQKSLQGDVAKLSLLNVEDFVDMVDSSVILGVLWNDYFKLYFNNDIKVFLEKLSRI